MLDLLLGLPRHALAWAQKKSRLHEFENLRREMPVNDLTNSASAPPTRKIRKLFLSCGDASGEAHALRLMTHLKARHPDLQIAGFGSQALADRGMDVWQPLADLNVMGFKDVLAQLPLFFRCVYQFAKAIQSEKPDAVVLIDYPGLNRHLLRIASRKGIPVVDYIAPQLWAWAPWRVRDFKKADKLLTILPFEADWFQRRGAHPEYIGHPLGDGLAAAAALEDAPPELDPALTWVGILPGSRRREIRNNLPLLLEAAVILRRRNSQVRFVLPHLRDEAWSWMAEALDSVDLPDAETILRAPRCFHQVLPQLQAAWVTSGTAVLETAAHRVPPVLVYHIPSAFTTWLYRQMLAIPFVGGLNLLTGQRVCPEHLGARICPEQLADDLEQRLDGDCRKDVLKSIEHWHRAFATPGPAARAAQAIESVLKP
jgi:lipid-A-disaccharide synthase